MINELTPRVNELLSELGRLQKKSILSRRDDMARAMAIAAMEIKKGNPGDEGGLPVVTAETESGEAGSEAEKREQAAGEIPAGTETQEAAGKSLHESETRMKDDRGVIYEQVMRTNAEWQKNSGIETRQKLAAQMARIEYKLRMEKEYQELMGFNFSEQNGMTHYMIGRRLLEIYEQLRVRAEIWNAGRKERQEIEGLFYALSYYMERATDEMEKMLSEAAARRQELPAENETDPIMKMLEAGKPEHHIYRLYNGRIQ